MISYKIRKVIIIRSLRWSPAISADSGRKRPFPMNFTWNIGIPQCYQVLNPHGSLGPQKVAFRKGIPLISGKTSLVKYYNLARIYVRYTLLMDPFGRFPGSIWVYVSFPNLVGFLVGARVYYLVNPMDHAWCSIYYCWTLRIRFGHVLQCGSWLEN